jgi:Uma2 family endonuclease
MLTPEEIKRAILQLAPIDRESMAYWFGNHTEHFVAEPSVAYGTDPEPKLLTVDEYLAFEETTPIRHEYIAGALYAMSGASLPHNRITMNLATALHLHLRGAPCRPYMLDAKLRLQVARDTIFYYPDIAVTCAPEPNEAYLEQPRLIIEVLSPSTEKIDRREKALHYRHIHTVEEYVLIAQKNPRIEIQRRTDNWQPTTITALDASAELRSLGLSLPLSQIYEDVPRTWTDDVQ